MLMCVLQAENFFLSVNMEICVYVGLCVWSCCCCCYSRCLQLLEILEISWNL